jgi:radical SAM superfamily enzyme YgiQ (UPF0313 family)
VVFLSDSKAVKGKRALLVNPPTGKYIRDDRCQGPVEALTAQPPRAPMDLAYMAASLEHLGVVCIVRDYPMENVSWDGFKSDLKEFNPDFLIISTTTPTLEFDMKACTLAKKRNKAVVTIAKGAQIVEEAKEVLKRYPDLDIGINGEYEFAVQEIVSHDLSTVKGITYRKGDEICQTEERPRLEDLDKLPLPARHLLKNELYTAPDTGKPIAFILTGRGCPCRCIYCAVCVASGHKLYVRSVDSVLKEIEQCYDKFGIREFFFRSDTFTWYEDWVVELCKGIVKRKFKIRWGTNSRVSTISEKRIAWMKKAGCYVIGFGIESGNQEMLNKMKKGITLDQARKAIELCRKYKIKSYTLFMFGLPWETKETAEDTIRFAKELNGDFADFMIAYPLPGTEFYDIAKRDKLFKGRLSGFDYAHPVTHSYHLSTEEIIKFRDRAIREFYLRPGYIMKTILGIRSPRVFVSYIKHGLLLVWHMIKKK